MLISDSKCLTCFQVCHTVPELSRIVFSTMFHIHCSYASVKFRASLFLHITYCIKFSLEYQPKQVTVVPDLYRPLLPTLSSAIICMSVFCSFTVLRQKKHFLRND